MDVLVDDEPRGWLKGPLGTSQVDSLHPPQESGKDAKDLPATLELLTAWLGDSQNLPDLGSRRLASAGTTAAGLMLLTDMPDAEDYEAGMLVAGAAGRLFDAMLGAIGRDRASIYLASLAPGRPATGKIAPDMEQELARLARHHVALAAPRLLVMFGDATIRALTGMGLAQARGSIHAVNLNGRTVPAIATFHPRFLLLQPARKADAWVDLRLMMEALAS